MDILEVAPEERVGQEIRGMHPYAFKSGQWGSIYGTTKIFDRLCYRIQWPDLLTDLWPVEDNMAEYEFRPKEGN